MQVRFGSVAAVIDDPDSFLKGYDTNNNGHEPVTSSSVEGGNIYSLTFYLFEFVFRSLLVWCIIA